MGARADSGWLWAVPWGIREYLGWVSQRYQHPKIYITENGCVVAASLYHRERVWWRPPFSLFLFLLVLFAFVTHNPSFIVVALPPSYGRG